MNKTIEQTLKFVMTPEGLKAFTDDRSAELLVENPEVFIAETLAPSISIGDELPCPDNIEWGVVYQYEPDPYRGWLECSDQDWAGAFYFSKRRKIIRLSVKQEETTRIQMPDQEYQVPR